MVSKGLNWSGGGGGGFAVCHQTKQIRRPLGRRVRGLTVCQYLSLRLSLGGLGGPSPPGGGRGGRCSIPCCNLQHLGPFWALLFRKYPRFRSLQTLARERRSEF